MSGRLLYPHAPIRDVQQLAMALHVSTECLDYCLSHQAELYRVVDEIPKPDGTTRRVYEALRPLKCVQEAVNVVLFRRLIYPSYLYGSVRGRDRFSYAQQHIESRLRVKLDITKFFDSISSDQVVRMFQGVFRFAPEVAVALAALTTLNGFVPQGSSTSPGIANAILWAAEHEVYLHLRKRGFCYTRYVDDIAVSTHCQVNRRVLDHVIATVRRMLKGTGLKLKRSKTRVVGRGQNFEVTGLSIGKKVGIPKSKRGNVRASAFQFKNAGVNDTGSEGTDSPARLLGRIQTIARVHPQEAAKLLRLAGLA